MCHIVVYVHKKQMDMKYICAHSIYIESPSLSFVQKKTALEHWYNATEKSKHTCFVFL